MYAGETYNQLQETAKITLKNNMALKLESVSHSNCMHGSYSLF